MPHSNVCDTHHYRHAILVTLAFDSARFDSVRFDSVEVWEVGYDFTAAAEVPVNSFSLR